MTARTIDLIAGIELNNFNGAGSPSPIGPNLLKDNAKFGDLLNGLIRSFRRSVKATLTVAGGTGGATAGTLSMVVTDLSDCPVNEVKEMVILASTAQYDPGAAVPDATVTFGTATVGSIVATGAGWALIKTDVNGNFTCVPSNSADETVYFSASPSTRGVSDLDAGVVAVVSNSDDATWAA